MKFTHHQRCQLDLEEALQQQKRRCQHLLMSLHFLLMRRHHRLLHPPLHEHHCHLLHPSLQEHHHCLLHLPPNIPTFLERDLFFSSSEQEVPPAAEQAPPHPAENPAEQASPPDNPWMQRRTPWMQRRTPWMQRRTQWQCIQRCHCLLRC